MASEIAIQKEVNPLVIFQQMASSGATMDQLNGFLTLQERFEAGEIRREITRDERSFNESMVKFHLDPPKIWKDKHVEFKTDRGVTAYDHATLGNATELITLALAKVGVTHEWVPSQAAGMITVTCRLKLGMYSKDTTISAGPDKSGGKNDIQAIISAQSYLERHTLLAASGMATHDQDDDGRGSELDQAVQNLVSDISTAADIADLQNVYMTAMKTTKKTKEDKPKQAAYIAAYNKRKAELSPKEGV